jgi:hypothetical protein
LWIVQELVLAKDAVVVCGESRLPWNMFQNAFYFLERCGLSTQIKSALTNNLTTWKSEYGREDRKRHFDLTRMLYRTRAHKATDPRDKIFGLLGIANEGSTGYVRADYSKSTREIYTSVTRRLLIADQHLELLGAVQFAEERANLSSWVADWSIGWVCSPLSPPNFDGSASYFAAGESRSEIENIGDPNKLCIRGILVDVIKETLSADRDFQHVSTAEYISDMVHELHLPEQYPHTAELRNYALFKTMTAELSPLSRRTGQIRPGNAVSRIHALAFDEANFGR